MSVVIERGVQTFRYRNEMYIITHAFLKVTPSTTKHTNKIQGHLGLP